MDTRHDEIRGEASLPFMDDKTHHHPGAISILEVTIGVLTTDEFERFCDATQDGAELWNEYVQFALAHPDRCSMLDYARHVLLLLPLEKP